MKKVKVDGHVNLLKDLETGAVISTRSNEYEQYVHLREAKEQESKKIDFMYQEILRLKAEISMIKNKLEEL